LTIDADIATSNDLVEYVVRQNVRDYSNKATDANIHILPHLTDEQIADKEKTGIIGFDQRKNENEQNEDAAVENALKCYEDGIFRMFIGDGEAEFGSPIIIKDGDEVTFIRLTMLAGRLW